MTSFILVISIRQASIQSCQQDSVLNPVQQQARLLTLSGGRVIVSQIQWLNVSRLLLQLNYNTVQRKLVEFVTQMVQTNMMVSSRKKILSKIL